MTDTEVINKSRADWIVTDQMVIKAWLEEHGIDATLVPADASFTFAAGSCTTQQYRHNENGKIILVRGSVRQDPITFAVQSPFPQTRHTDIVATARAGLAPVTPPSEGTKP